MAQLKQDIVNMKGDTVGSMDLDAAVFGGKVVPSVVHSVIRWQRAKRRAGTASTLNRAAMKGGGKKPWKQKGTGNARAGSRNSPLWVGGAVTFGPQPRSYEFKLPKNVKRKALSSVLTDKYNNKNLVILDELSVESGKTKDMQGVLSSLGLKDKKIVLLMPEKEVSVWRSTGNLKNVTSLPVAGANVYDLVHANVVVGTQAAITALQGRLLGNQTKEQ